MSEVLTVPSLSVDSQHGFVIIFLNLFVYNILFKSVPPFQRVKVTKIHTLKLSYIYVVRGYVYTVNTRQAAERASGHSGVRGVRGHVRAHVRARAARVRRAAAGAAAARAPAPQLEGGERARPAACHQLVDFIY